MSLKYDSFKKLRKEKAKHKIDSWEEYDDLEAEILKERMQGKEPTIKAQVRITGGKFKNFNIEIPKNTRPLTDRMKIRIFDILGSDIANKTILDLFAGSGSFGLDALSRGAKSCTFIDASRHSERILKMNLEKMGLTETEVIRGKVDDFLFKNQQNDSVFEIIFMDPPYKLYNTKRTQKMNETISMASNLLPAVKKSKGRFKGALIIKHPRRYPIDSLEFEHIKKVETYDFGLNAISLYILKK
ncbi:RsmD family RNA methyltransferase [bacterium]|nr:RsmD family RNA methyltransferase [bacterium]